MYTPLPEHVYEAKPYNLHGLEGISDSTLSMHLKLYEGYVGQTNTLTGRLRDILLNGHIDEEQMPAYSELKRRFGFEFNGMVLHEYYFDNLQAGGSKEPKPNSAFRNAVEKSFGTYETWKADFIGAGMIRGVGWAICDLNPYNGVLSNHWITLHDIGNVAGFVPILVMDVWEHAYLLDYKPSERGDYIESFFANINWGTLDHRLHRTVAPTSLTPCG